MKRILVALSFAVIAAPAFALDSTLPYEQTQFDRGLYNLEQRASSGSTQAQDSAFAGDHNVIAPAQ
jgi:hypothetical protein